MKSYDDLEKICYELKSEVEKTHNMFGIELRLIGFDNGEALVIVGKEIKDIIEKIKINLNSIFVGIYHLSEVSNKDYEVLYLYDYYDKMILELANYFNALLPVATGEYPFFFDALGLYEGSLNQLCFDIITKAFYDAKTFNMKYQENVNNNFDIVKVSLFLAYDKNGNILDNNIKKKKLNN